MVRNEDKYQQALQFRKRGFTLEEIAKICDVSKSTVSKWLKNNATSAKITIENKHRVGIENAKRLKLVNKTRNTERTKRYKEIEKSALVEFKHYKNDALFMAGLMLYVLSGDLHNEHSIRFSNTSPDAHKIFINFLKEYLGVELLTIRIWLLLYPTHNEEVCMKKWRRVTGLTFQQFHKTQFIKQKPKKTLHYGVGNTIIGNTVLKRKLDVWVKLAIKELKTK